MLAAVTACFTATTASVFAETPAAPSISAKAAYVMDAGSGEEIYAKNADDTKDVEEIVSNIDFRYQ